MQSRSRAAFKKKKIFGNTTIEYPSTNNTQNQMMITSRKKQNNIKKSRYSKKKMSGGLPFFDGQIFDKEILLDNTAIYVDCIFANGISFSTEISEIIDGLLFKCMVIGPIIIPDNIIKIGSQSFYECKMSENKLTLSKNIKHISDKAFYNSSFGESLFFPKTIEYIGKNAFANCNNVKSIVFDNESAINEITFQTFYNCLLLEKIVLPMNLISIGDKAFSKCVNLQTIENLNNTQYIGIQAFSYCFDLNIDINNLLQSVKTIRKTAFYGCYKISQQNRPSPNIFSRVFQEQFNFDLYKHTNINLAKMIGTYNIHGDIKNPNNLNGFCKIYASWDSNTTIGHFINNKREGFILNKKRYESSIIEYTNDIEKMDSYQFKNILTRHNTTLPSIFEYKNTTYLDKSGNKINIMKGILNILEAKFIGIWNKKDDNLYYFNGYIKKNNHIERLENGIHSFKDKIYAHSEIEYFEIIDKGRDIFIFLENQLENVNEKQDGKAESYELSRRNNIKQWNTRLDKLLKYNIINFSLLPSFSTSGEIRADDSIHMFSIHKPMYESIIFVNKDENTQDTMNLNIEIQELNENYNFIKVNYFYIQNIYLEAYEKTVSKIQKYFDDLDQQPIKIDLLIHHRLKSTLETLKSKIPLYKKTLEYFNSPKNNLYVINDETQIYLEESN